MELGSFVTILSLPEIDKYVVHGVWGHCWQTTMSRLGQIATFVDPFDLTEEAPLTGHGNIRFENCFVQMDSAVTLDESMFRRFVRAEFPERLSVALTLVFAEMLADIIQYKFLEDNSGR